MQDNRPAVYAEGDNTIIYRASSLGHCLRELWAARNNMERRPLPRVVQQGMDEGTNLEPIILNLLYEKHNFTFAYGSQFQVELNVGAWNGKTLIVRGKVDEIGAPLGRINYPIDVKAFTDDDVRKYLSGGLKAFPRYAWQQSVYACGYGTDYVYMPIFHKGAWEIEEWSLEPIAPPYSTEQIRDRVLTVEEAYYANHMPDDCPGDYACPYYYLHDEKPIGDFPLSLAPMVRARIKLSQRITSLEDARKELDNVIKGKLDQDITYHYDRYSIVYYTNPRRFNTDAAKRLLTEAEIDWEHEDEWWIPGNGTQLRITTPKARE